MFTLPGKYDPRQWKLQEVKQWKLCINLKFTCCNIDKKNILVHKHTIISGKDLPKSSRTS